nr:hypothetical protein [Tanacetum cinerariifolium]
MKEEVKIELEKGRFRVMELECLMLRKELEKGEKENSLLRQLQLPNEEKGSSKEDEDEDLNMFISVLNSNHYL